MNASVCSILTAGVAVIGASAIAIAPSVQPPPPSAPAIQLRAAVQPLAQPVDPVSFVTDWAERIVMPPSLGAAVPTPPPVVSPAPGSVGSTIKNVYNAVEPWVRYGFELAAYAVGWVPYVGWLAPQITIFYNFGERIVRSGVFNFADWIDGNGSFVQNLTEFGIDTVNSFIFLANDQLAFWLPPLPPLPPLPGGSLQATTLTAPAVRAASTPITPKEALQLAQDRVGAQTKALRKVAQTAVGVTTTAASEAASAVTDVVTGETPLPKAVSDAVKQVRATVAETVPGTVADAKDFTAGNARLVNSVVVAPRTVAKGIVNAQGEVRGAVTKANTGVSKAAVSGEQGVVRKAVTDAPGTVAKGVSDGVKAATDGVKKVRDDVRTAVRNVHSDATK